MRVSVCTGYVPLEVRHLTKDQYMAYGDRLGRAVCAGGATFSLIETKLDACWLTQWLRDEAPGHTFPPANDVPADRYATPQHMVLSNIVQHQRTTWLRQCASIIYPDADVLVWLDLGILKQGDWTGKPVTEDVVTKFCEKLSLMETLDVIPFPGIWPKGEIADFGANWRFVGSTHIVPKKFLSMVDFAYKIECQDFIRRTKTIPLDLPIWAWTERNWMPMLPFRQYAANHDATQLTGLET